MRRKGWRLPATRRGGPGPVLEAVVASFLFPRLPLSGRLWVCVSDPHSVGAAWGRDLSHKLSELTAHNV